MAIMLLNVPGFKVSTLSFRVQQSTWLVVYARLFGAIVSL